MSAELPPIRERLAEIGLLGLKSPAAPDVWLPALRRWAETLMGDYARRAAERDEVQRLLREAGVQSPAKAVDAALRVVRERAPSIETDTDAGTVGGGIVDAVSTHAGLAWLAIQDGTPTIATEIDGRKPWPRRTLPWPTIPSDREVRRALEAGATAPLPELAAFIASRVVLHEPREVWADLLAAWSLGTYLLDEFTYFPLLLFEGPPERGKTRCAKSILWPAFRGIFTPTPTAATLFRDRSRHRVTILVDVEDVSERLARSDLMDLVLAGFERDGVVRRCTRPDAEPENQIETFAAYGASILTSNVPVRAQSPLASRCLRVPLPEAGGVLVPDAATPADAAELRARAVAWAAAHQAMGDPLPEVDVPFTGRMRDLSLPLLRVLAAVAPGRLDRAVKLLVTLDHDRRSEVADSWEGRVAIALWEARHRVEAGRLYHGDILPHVNEGYSEGEQLNEQQVGVARRNLGLQSGRGGRRGRSFVVWPGDAEARALHDRYQPASHTPTEIGSERGSACSASSDGQSPQGFSTLNTPLNTLNTPSDLFSAGSPHNSATTEHAEHAEHPQRPESETPSETGGTE